MEYKVSKESSELVRAYDLVGEIYGRVVDAMSELYTEEHALQIVEERLNPELSKIRETLLGLLAVTFEANRCWLGSNKV